MAQMQQNSGILPTAAQSTGDSALVFPSGTGFVAAQAPAQAGPGNEQEILRLLQAQQALATLRAAVEPGLAPANRPASAAQLQTAARALITHWQGQQQGALLDTFRPLLQALEFGANVNLFQEIDQRYGAALQARAVPQQFQLSPADQLQLQLLGHIWNQQLQREERLRGLQNMPQGDVQSALAVLSFVNDRLAGTTVLNRFSSLQAAWNGNDVVGFVINRLVPHAQDSREVRDTLNRLYRLHVDWRNENGTDVQAYVGQIQDWQRANGYPLLAIPPRPAPGHRPPRNGEERPMVLITTGPGNERDFQTVLNALRTQLGNPQHLDFSWHQSGDGPPTVRFFGYDGVGHRLIVPLPANDAACVQSIRDGIQAHLQGR